MDLIEVSTQINNSNTLETLDCVSRQPNLQPTCNQLATDTINRQAAIDAVNTALFPKINTAKDAEKALRGVPTVQPKRTKGEWITSDDLWETGICSCCCWDSQEPVSYAVTMFKFCPHCGADMRGEAE